MTPRFFQKLKAKTTEIRSRKIPESINNKLIKRGVLEITGQCNLNCFHCYAIGKRNLTDMSTAKILNLIDEMVAENTLFLTITGGEPLARKDFLKIYKHLRLKGIIPSMISNVTLLNEEILDLFIQYPPDHIKISLYGASPETHDFVTRIPGSFERTLASVQKLRKAGINCFFGVTLFKETSKDFEKIKNLAESLGMPVSFGSSLIPTLEKDCSFFGHQVSNGEVLKMIREHGINAKRDFIATPERSSVIKAQPGKIYNCIAGLNSYCISSDGSVTLCQSDPNREISLKERSLKEALQLLKKARRQRLTAPAGCQQCPLIYNLLKK